MYEAARLSFWALTCACCYFCFLAGGCLLVSASDYLFSMSLSLFFVLMPIFSHISTLEAPLLSSALHLNLGCRLNNILTVYMSGEVLYTGCWYPGHIATCLVWMIFMSDQIRTALVMHIHFTSPQVLFIRFTIIIKCTRMELSNIAQ